MSASLMNTMVLLGAVFVARGIDFEVQSKKKSTCVNLTVEIDFVFQLLS